ncbi:hypothetical protein GCM10010503_37410 [Streptomyces lucensis JCM 4490]|uniref:Uncharacterized protein n=1 Tax=Streptomyces lucensis JCM 4490 TaxID=1306176 RepID=A0A918MTA9_9ACTN|nr:hypothetical protein [Streptomyces lucensis]GGW56715.1 hypothetical protein GCM10010503_37410 [Streptomyces lucensis JCM 4490]
MLRSAFQQELAALFGIAARQPEAGQDDLRTGDRIQRHAGELARAGERFHPIGKVLLCIPPAHAFLRSRWEAHTTCRQKIV